MEKFMLEAALTALEAKKVELNAQIEQVSRALGMRPTRAAKAVTASEPVRVKMNSTGHAIRIMSKAGRAAIAAAQTKRWAKVRREKKAAVKAKGEKKLVKKAAKATRKLEAIAA